MSPEKINKEIKDYYLVSIRDNFTQKMFYILVPNRIDLAVMIGLLSVEKYTIITILPLFDLKNFEEFIVQLRKEQKPKDLNFG